MNFAGPASEAVASEDKQEADCLQPIRCGGTLHCGRPGRWLRWEWRDLNMKIHGGSGLLSVDLK